MAACSLIAIRRCLANWWLCAEQRIAHGSCRHLGRGEGASARFSARQGLHKGVEQVPLDGSAIVGNDNEAVTPMKGAARHEHRIGIACVLAQLYLRLWRLIAVPSHYRNLSPGHYSHYHPGPVSIQARSPSVDIPSRRSDHSDRLCTEHIPTSHR